MSMDSSINTDNTDRHLYILWTSGDPNTAHYMVFMYAVNSLKAGWWDKVTVIIWGASAKLILDDETVRERIKMARELGVAVTACHSCAAQLGAIDTLTVLGVEIIGWGQPITELLQSGAPLITV